MDIDNKISLLIEQQFPDHVRDSGPNLIAFIKAYYEWMEQKGNSLYESKSLLSNHDIDTTVDEFLDYFEKEILWRFPEEILANPRLLIKNVKEIYRARGSEKSFNLLFRSLYNEDIDYYYPGEDILRASDGRWVVDNILRVSKPFTGEVFDLLGLQIIGQTTGATATVTNIIKTRELGFPIYELTIKDILGEFEDGELIRDRDNLVASGQVFNTFGKLQKIDIEDGGAGHYVKDQVKIQGGTGTGAKGTVTKTKDDSAVQWIIIDGGSGYRLGANYPYIPPINHKTGYNTSFIIDTLSNLESFEFNIDFIEPYLSCKLIAEGFTANQITGTANIALGDNYMVFSYGAGGGEDIRTRISNNHLIRITGYANSFHANTEVGTWSNQIIFFNETSNMTINDANVFNTSQYQNTSTTNISLANATLSNVIYDSWTHDSFQTGTINSISTTNVGYNYTTLPTVGTPLDANVARWKVSDGSGGIKGKNAIIEARHTRGTIVTVRVDVRGTQYREGTLIDVINTDRTALADARGWPGVTGILTKNGRYVDTKGWLSWNNKLQDNYYYQEYSYVLKSKHAVLEYGDIVKKLLHVAGTEMFGIVTFEPKINLTSNTDSEIWIWVEGTGTLSI